MRQFYYILFVVSMILFIKASLNSDHIFQERNSFILYDSLIIPVSDSLQIADDLFKGKKLYEKKCKTCHTLYKPNEFKLKVWKENLREMKVKADLNKEEYNLIFNYLAENCKK